MNVFNVVKEGLPSFTVFSGERKLVRYVLGDFFSPVFGLPDTV